MTRTRLFYGTAAAVAAGLVVWFAAGTQPPASTGLRGRLLASDGSPLARRMIILHADAAGGESLQDGARTAPDGAFAFPGAPPGVVELQIPADPSTFDTFALGSYWSVTFRHDGRERTLRLPGGPRVDGAVAGILPRAARVRVGLCPLSAADAEFPAFVGSVPVGRDGRFRFDGVPPGRYLAVAWQEWSIAPEPEEPPGAHGPEETAGSNPPGGLVVEPLAAAGAPRDSSYVTVRTPVEVGTAPVVVALRFPEAAARGRIPASADKASAAGANVLLMDAGPVRPAYAQRFLPDGACVAFVTADGDGRFEVPGLAPGRYLVRVTAAAPGAPLVVERTVDVAPGAEIDLTR